MADYQVIDKEAEQVEREIEQYRQIMQQKTQGCFSHGREKCTGFLHTSIEKVLTLHNIQTEILFTLI